MQKPRLAVLIHDDFPELDLWYPVFRLREEEAGPKVIGLEAGQAYRSRLGYAVLPDLAVADARAEDFDVVVVTGGGSGTRIAETPALVDFVTKAAAAGAVVAALSSGRSVLEKAGLALPAPGQGVAVEGTVVTGGDLDDLPGLMTAIAQVLDQRRRAA